MVQYANMCFRHTVDYCDKKDFTYAYISHKSFWGKNCARLTGSTPPEIQTSNCTIKILRISIMFS